MTELPPARVKGQRPGICKTCRDKGRKGAILYYPRPGIDADTAGAETAGSWAHRDPADWLDDPHEPIPDEAGS